MDTRKIPVTVTEVDEWQDAAVHALDVLTIELLETPQATKGPSALHHHLLHASIRVQDVGIILARMHRVRDRIRQEDVAEHEALARGRTLEGTAPSSPSDELRNVQLITADNPDPRHSLRIDFESLYLFGSILLDQWSLAAAYIAGLSVPDQYSFSKLVTLLDDDAYAGSLQALWSAHHRLMLWLDLQLRFYRNRFIVHQDRPWQFSESWSTYGNDFIIFRPALPGSIDQSLMVREINELIPIATSALGGTEVDWQNEGPRRVLEELSNGVGQIPDRRNRQRVRELMGKYGVATSSFQTLGARLLGFVIQVSPALRELVVSRPASVAFGSPKMESAT